MLVSIPLKVNDLSTPKVVSPKKRRGRPKKDSTIRKMDISPKRNMAYSSKKVQQIKPKNMSLPMVSGHQEQNSSKSYHTLPVYDEISNLNTEKPEKPKPKREEYPIIDSKITINMNGAPDAKLVLTL